MRLKRCWGGVFLAISLAGCSALPLESPRVPHPSSRSVQKTTHRYREMVGVIHIHSTYSDGQLPIEAVAQTANAQGLDYLIFTDHDTLRAKREGKERWFGRTLVLIGEEISTRGGHYVALRVADEVPRLKDPQWTAEAVSAQGGLGFIAHPFWKRKPWKNPKIQGITGLEIYNAAEDVSEESIFRLGIWTIFAGSDFSIVKWLDRPTESLDLWDQMLVEGNRVVGIGVADAHGLRRFGLRLGPYATVFKLVRNHLLVPGLSPEAIYDALSLGHLFIAHDLVADSKGFFFGVVSGSQTEGIMGDRVKHKEGLRLYAYLPSPGESVLVKDGRATAKVRGQHAWFDVSGPGVYRLEATREGKPWIYSNPIYVVIE